MKSKKRVLTTLRILICFFALGMFVPVTVYAGAGYHNLAGITFQPLIFAQATKLVRSHVRISNPITNNLSYWVVGSVPRVQEDIAATTSAPYGYINAFYYAGASQPILCVEREFNFNTVQIPGINPDDVNTVNAVSTLISVPMTTPNYSLAFFSFPVNSNSSFAFYTIVCKLPPGTGLQSVDFYQR